MCVTRGSHSFTCHPHANRIYSTAARHHRPMAGTHYAYPQRDDLAELSSNIIYFFLIFDDFCDFLTQFILSLIFIFYLVLVSCYCQVHVKHNYTVYVTRTVELAAGCFDVDKCDPQWYHYFLCGYRGILEHFGLSGTRGLDILCDGTIPRCAGLASSSALVCCSALITMHAYNKQLSRVTDHFCVCVIFKSINTCCL